MAKIADVMTRNVRAVRAGESLSSAAALMWQGDCGAVPVLDEQGDRVIGMITDRDICMATWSKDRPPSEVRVADVMSCSLAFCSPDDSLSHARTLMSERRVRRIPVLDAHRHLQGIITLADLARTESTRLVPMGSLVSTIADICEPRHDGSRFSAFESAR